MCDRSHGPRVGCTSLSINLWMLRVTLQVEPNQSVTAVQSGRRRLLRAWAPWSPRGSFAVQRVTLYNKHVALMSEPVCVVKKRLLSGLLALCVSVAPERGPKVMPLHGIVLMTHPILWTMFSLLLCMILFPRVWSCVHSVVLMFLWRLYKADLCFCLLIFYFTQQLVDFRTMCVFYKAWYLLKKDEEASRSSGVLEIYNENPIKLYFYIASRILV